MLIKEKRQILRGVQNGSQRYFTRNPNHFYIDNVVSKSPRFF
jgi:hypothetical protein